MGSSAEDLVLLERVFLKLATVEGDSQLEGFLGKFLTPLIAKLDSTDEVVRSKVVELLNHINKRLKSASNVSLPFETLLDIYSDSKSAFVQNFAFVYVKMGFHKFIDTSAVDKVSLVSRVTACVNRALEAHSSSFFQALVVLLSRLSQAQSQTFPFAGLSDKQTSRLLDLILHVLITPYGFAPNPQENIPVVNAPPCLTEANFRQATGDILSPLYAVAVKYSELKIGLTKFLANSTLDANVYAIHLMMANADTADAVSTVGEMQLRRITVDYEDKQLIERLFALYLGDPTNKPPTENFRVAADLRLRLKLIGYLSKSSLAAELFPQNVQIVYETFFGSGGTNGKLKQKVLAFIQAVSNSSSTNPVKTTVLPLMFTAVNKLIRETQEGQQPLKSSAYTTLGKLGAAAPALVNKDISLVRELFNGVKQETSEVSSSIVECLSLWTSAFQHSNATVMADMEQLITSYIADDHSQCRLLAVKYIEKIFETSHVASRYLLCLMCGDNNENIRREAKRVLMGSTKSATTKLPHFSEVVDIFYGKAVQRTAAGTIVSVGNVPLPFSAETYLELIRFVRMSLFQTVGVSLSSEEMENSQLIGPKLAEWLRGQLNGPPVELENSSVVKYVKLLLPLCEATQELFVWSALCEIVASSNWELSHLVVVKLDWMRGTLVETANDQLISTVAEIIAGVMVKTSDGQMLAEYLTELLKRSEAGVTGSQNHITVSGYLFGEMQRRRVDDKHLAELSCRCFSQLTSLLNKDVSMTLLESVVSATYLICLSDNSDVACPIFISDPSSSSVVEKIVDFALEMVQSRKESVKPKLKEKLIATLSVAVGRDDKLTRKVLEGLALVGEGPPQPELQFSIGEAMVNAALGLRSPKRRNFWTESESSWNSRWSVASASNSLLDWLVEEVLKKSQSPNRHLRQSVYIWLFIMLKQMQKESALTTRLLDVQAALGNGLAENSDLTQDVVSKAMGILYELGTPDQQKRLVELLVETLMTGKRQTVQITGETELFDKNLIGKTPTGENISTYQELCSLASDLNKPDLIYQFMSIANHQSLWNSKAGAAFGVSTVFTHAKEQLEPFLPKFVPRLYRYQFDPNPKVQQSMKTIWTTLLSNEKGIVEKFSQEIFQDILKNLTNNQWRVRESSCLACSDLVSSQGLFGFTPQLEELWDTLFRVRDDIKESVRLAAEKTLQTLKKVVVNRCVGVEAGERGREVLGVTLKVLLEKGIQCKAAEVRGVSLDILISVSKEAGRLLKPHLVTLVPKLLESLSELEPSVINYMAVRATGAELERLDDARVALSKTTPVADTLNTCARYVDAAVLVDLIPHLCDLLRSAPLGTKAGVCGFITTLCANCPNDMRGKSADRLLKSLTPSLTDRNATVRKQSASAIGNIVKFASDVSVGALFDHLKKLFLEKPELADRTSVAKALQSIVSQQPDVVKNFGDQILPVVFIGLSGEVPKGDEERKNLVAAWEEVWSETTPGMSGGLRLYLSDIRTLCATILRENPSWALKAEAGRTLARAASEAGGSLSQEQARDLLDILKESLTGRTWTGKENLLFGIENVCAHCRETLSDVDIQWQKSLFDAVLKEAKKSNPEYRLAALKALTAVVCCFKLPIFEEIWVFAAPFLMDSDDSRSILPSDEESDDVQKKKQHEETRIGLIAALYSLLAGAIQPGVEDVANLRSLVQLACRQLNKSYWKMQLSMVECLTKAVKYRREELGESVIKEVLKAAAQCRDDVSQAVLVTAATELVQLFH